MAREQATFVVTFRPTVVGIDPIRALRAVLKFALRRFGLRCTGARTPDPAAWRFLSSLSLRTPTFLAAERRRQRGRTQARRQEKIMMDMRKYSGTVFRKIDDVKANGAASGRDRESHGGQIRKARSGVRRRLQAECQRHQ